VIATVNNKFEKDYGDYVSAKLNWDSVYSSSTQRDEDIANAPSSSSAAATQANADITNLKSIDTVVAEQATDASQLNSNFQTQEIQSNALLADAAALTLAVMDASPIGRTPAMLVGLYTRIQPDDLQLTVTIIPASQTQSSTPQTAQSPSSQSVSQNQGGGGGGKGGGGGGAASQQATTSPNTATASAVTASASPFSSQTLTIPVTHGWEGAFSLGVVDTTLASRSYYIPYNSTPPSPLKIQQSTRSKLNVSAAALAHYNYIISSQWAAGPTFGITPIAPYQYLLGLDVAYGHTSKLILSGGMAFGQETEAIGINQGTTPTVNTANVFTNGYFGSLTFSLALP